MSSIIEGYNYDIFISYRQKDNKYDGWVTEFVDNLKRELDATFKEEVSVYFDINPHDGLLDTHDVDASLKEKLNCLICIPIISRTYCDPKSFAWEHEFKPFIEKANQDRFGLKVTLSGGNVANRVLPVRINDLDLSDVKLFESAIGGVLRPIDFTYKEPGVNRPLRSRDDNIIKSPSQILYRDQINKVALAIKEIIESIKIRVNPVLTKEQEPQEIISSKNKEEVVGKSVYPENKPEQPIKAGLPEKDTGGKLLIIKRKIIVPALIILVAVFLPLFALLNHRSKVSWAKEKALPQIEQLRNEDNYSSAFNLVQKTEKYLLKDPKFQELNASVTSKLTILTDPPGAEVYIRKYADPNGEWTKLGLTPINRIKMPKFTFYLVKIKKAGYEDLTGVASSQLDTLSRKMMKKGTIPSGMVYVDCLGDADSNKVWRNNSGFFIDRFEVTNKQYKEFIDQGGYRKPEYWKNPFIKNAKTLSWKEAMAEFVDKTGRPGPSLWIGGDYPDGQDDYPVTGVSWYEAVAYANFAGKDLPTAIHWDSGAGFYMPPFINSFGSKILPLSNYNGKGAEPVGKMQGIGPFGTFDMAGNAREWCLNEVTGGRIISGGGWEDMNYLYISWSQLPPFDRSPQNGFRCVQYIDKEKIPKTAFRRIELGNAEDYSRERPVPDNVFNIYKNQFLYDKTDLNPVMEEKDAKSKDWVIEKVSFNAAYENDRMILYLYLPTIGTPPYQTLIFFPGSYAVTERDLKNSKNSMWFLDYVLKSGRAVAYPVYFRTFERNDGERVHIQSKSHQYSELLVKLVKDFRRSVDYLETRKDIDSGKLGFYGHSWGGILGGIIPALEDRLAVNILIVGGFPGYEAFPESEAINYVPRVKIPTLMLNGRYDPRFPEKTNLLPFFNLLGTPEKDKRLVIYETDHYVPRSEMIKETLNFLDRYLGPVK
jgi:dienelactone hydrolase